MQCPVEGDELVLGAVLLKLAIGIAQVVGESDQVCGKQTRGKQTRCKESKGAQTWRKRAATQPEALAARPCSKGLGACNTVGYQNSAAATNCQAVKLLTCQQSDRCRAVRHSLPMQLLCLPCCSRGLSYTLRLPVQAEQRAGGPCIWMGMIT